MDVQKNHYFDSQPASSLTVHELMQHLEFSSFGHRSSELSFQTTYVAKYLLKIRMQDEFFTVYAVSALSNTSRFVKSIDDYVNDGS